MIIRERIDSQLPTDYFERKQSEGWKLRAVEWEKEDAALAGAEATPYGLQLIPETARLEQNPTEISVLLTILEMIVEDASVPRIAEELNRRNFTNRSGRQWTSPAVFDLLPRVIEMGPALLKSPDWVALRPRVAARKGMA